MPPFFMASAILPGYAADQLLDPSAIQPEYKKSDGNYYNTVNADPWIETEPVVLAAPKTTKTRSTK